MFPNNSIVITPNQVRNKILKQYENDKILYKIKFISLEELIDHLTFTYSSKAIYYLMDKYHYKYEVALIFLNNLKFINDDDYDDNLLIQLKELKAELDDKGLLNYDRYFSYFLNNKKIYFYSYDYIPNKILDMLNGFDLKIINEPLNDKDFKCFEFNNLEDEVGFVLSEIANLITDGVSLNKIKIISQNEYNYILERMANDFNIPINLNIKTAIYNTNLGQHFFDILEDDKIKVINQLNDNNDIYNEIIKIINKYCWADSLVKVKEMLIYDFKHTYKKEGYFEHGVSVETLRDNNFSEDDYVFLLGFNQGSYPKIYQDEDLLSDKLKIKLGLDTSDDVNKIIKDKLIHKLSNINNLVITYKLKSPFETYYPSLLINELKMDVIKDENPSLSYSHKYNKIRLGKYLDQLIKFNKKDINLDSLYSTYPDLNYLTFDNKFTGINQKKLINFIAPELRLSYTKINEYYQCGFKYYLSNILKLNIYEERFSLFIGNFFHYILSYAFNDSFNFDDKVEEFLKANPKLTPKESFLLIKLKEELKFTINTIKKQSQSLGYKDALYEEKVIISRDENVKITFTGIIDKLLYKEVGEFTYIAVVDYKTGSIDLGLENIIYGLNLQLPIYLYLAKNTNKLKNVKVYGFYLQPILVNEFKKEPKKSYEEVKTGKLRLQGYSLINSDLDKEFDLQKENSKVIQGMKLKNDGSYYSYSKVLLDEEIEKVYEIAKSKIDEAIKDILNAKFDINPKLLDQDDVSCKFCKFKDICFKTDKDYIRFKRSKGLGFLSGDKNEMD